MQTATWSQIDQSFSIVSAARVSSPILSRVDVNGTLVNITGSWLLWKESRVYEGMLSYNIAEHRKLISAQYARRTVENKLLSHDALLYKIENKLYQHIRP